MDERVGVPLAGLKDRDVAPWIGAALVGRLLVTLNFSDLNNAEKTARLDPPLPMTAMPDGDDPIPQDIGWYAPSNDVVLYYGDVGYWPASAVSLMASTPSPSNAASFPQLSSWPPKARRSEAPLGNDTLRETNQR